MEERAKGRNNFGRQIRFHQSLFHKLHPPIAATLIDCKWRMSHSQSRMTALLRIVIGAAKTLDQKITQAFFGAGEILIGIERAEKVIAGDALVEVGDEACEAFVADDR